MKIFVLLGFFAGLLGVVGTLVSGTHIKNPWGLVVLVLGIPSVWLVFSSILSITWLRVCDSEVEWYLWRKVLLASCPVSSIVQVVPGSFSAVVIKTDSVDIHLFGLHASRRLALAEHLLKLNPNIKSGWHDEQRAAQPVIRADGLWSSISLYGFVQWPPLTSMPGIVMTNAGLDKDGVSRRDLSAWYCQNVDELLKTVDLPMHHFVCLLAWDSRDTSVETVAGVARHLIGKGCVYICCWGPGSERVHDIFDEIDLELNPDPPWVMSTWHDDEPLSEALWFSLNNTTPDDAFVDDCKTLVGIAISNAGWAAEIQEAFRNPREFNARPPARE